MFVKAGGLCSDWIDMTIGLGEGDVLSPLEFIITIDCNIQRLHNATLPPDVRIGIPMLDGTALSSVWFADDGQLLALDHAGMTELLRVCGDDFGEQSFVFNPAPTKSASQRHLPWDKARRAAAKRVCDALPAYELQGKALPSVAGYKHLGVYTSSGGARAAVKMQLERLAPIAAMVIRQAATVPLHQRSVLYRHRLYVTYWLPKFMYGISLWATAPPQLVEDTESVVLRMSMASPNTPLVALRSVVGLPTLQTRFDLDRLRMFLGFVATPARSYVRQQLCVELALWTRLRSGGGEHRVWARRLWWERTMQLLRRMDAATTPALRAQHPRIPESWVAWARMVAESWEVEFNISSEIRLAYKAVLLEVEACRRRWELQRSAASLGEVRDLLDTPNVAPFVVDTRRDLVALRVQLRGGRRVLFGYRHFHLDRCPWCGLVGEFTVPHLVRDCHEWEATRVVTWERAAAIAAAAGVQMLPGTVEQHRQQWYRLTCGAAVGGDFIGLDLDRPTHFARGNVPATRHLRVALPVYERLLVVTGAFLRELVVRTRERLEAGDEMWGYTPEANAPRVTIHHAAREVAEMDAIGDSESDSDDSDDGGGDVDEWDAVRTRVVAALRQGDREGAAAVLREALRPLFFEEEVEGGVPVAVGDAEVDFDELAAVMGQLGDGGDV